MEGSPHKDLIIKQVPLHQDDVGDDDPRHLHCHPSPSSIIKDSPFFNYISNLSPIEPVKFIHVAQGFGDLPLLPPPTVFTSPHDVSRVEIISSKSTAHGGSSGLKKLSSNHGNEAALHPSTPSNFGQIKVGSLIRYFEMVPCSQKESRDQDSLLFSTTSPSACVDDCLADSLDGYKKRDDSPDSCPNQANEPSQLQGSNSSCNHEAYSRHDMEVNADKGKIHSQALLEVSKGVHLHAAVESVRFQVEIAPNDLAKEIDLVVQETGNTEHEKWPDFLVEDNNAFETSDSLQSESRASIIQNSEHVNDQITIALSPEVSKVHKDGSVVKKSNLVTFSNFHENSNKDVIAQHTESVPQNDWNTSQLLLESVTAVDHDTPSGKVTTSGDEKVVDKKLIMAENVHNQHGLPSMLSPYPYKKTPLVREKSDKSIQKSESSSRACIKPLGIGLHLNSIGSKLEKDTVCQKPFLRNDNTMSQMENSSSIVSQHSSNDQEFGIDNTGSAEKFASSESPITCHFSEQVDMEQEASGVVTPEPTFHALLLGAVGMDSCINSEDFCSDLTLIGNETPASVVACVSQEEINQLNVKKRKKSVGATKESCKRCKCKKSKCLKLYCDCFAAGTYCIGSCTCQECLNQPEFKDKVIAARQLIESRNPLAFAPKVMWHIVEASPNSSAGEVTETPTSARHKRGCNCKRSKCLKKYCECYQAGVGCSDGCRCESCKNIFGKKEGCLQIEYKPAEDIGWEERPENNVSLGKADKNPLHLDRCHPSNLTPVTPLLQYSSHGTTFSKPQVAGRKHPSSPESEASNRQLTSGTPRRSQRLIADNYRLSKDTQGNSDIAVCKQTQHDLKDSKVNQFSPSWDQPMEVCTTTPLPYPSSVTVAESADADRGLGGQPHYKGVVPSRLFDLQNCPATPMHHIGNKKVLEMDCDDGIHSNIDVETTKILNSTSSPIKVVKAGSPNQKRVSPPHICLTDLARSTTSPGLRSSRKFILQSVPPFPPLTPCCESKTNEK